MPRSAATWRSSGSNMPVGPRERRGLVGAEIGRFIGGRVVRDGLGHSMVSFREGRRVCRAHCPVIRTADGGDEKKAWMKPRLDVCRRFRVSSRSFLGGVTTVTRMTGRSVRSVRLACHRAHPDLGHPTLITGRRLRGDGVRRLPVGEHQHRGTCPDTTAARPRRAGRTSFDASG